MFYRTLLLSLLSLFLFLPAFAQSTLCNDSMQQQPRSVFDPARPRDVNPQQPDIPADMQRKQAKEMNEQRQASLKKDTDKLLEIATELKQQVDKTNENQLSLQVIRKTEEVEKLAKSIRDKMKSGGYCDLVVPSQGQ